MVPNNTFDWRRGGEFDGLYGVGLLWRFAFEYHVDGGMATHMVGSDSS